MDWNRQGQGQPIIVWQSLVKKSRNPVETSQIDSKTGFLGLQR